MHPSTKGATMVYNTYILPGMQQMEGHIEKAEKLVGDGFDKAKAAALEKAEEAKKKVM